MAVNAYLTIAGIPGDDNGNIDLESFNWGVANSATPCASSSQGAGSGKTTFQDFSFTSRLGSQSPQLFLKTATGAHIPKAKLTLESDTASPITVVFTEIVVSSYTQDLTVQKTDTEAPSHPAEHVSFNFSSIAVTYQEQTSTFDICTGTGS